MKRRVLAIDGGGIRGIIPAMVMAHVEKETGRPAGELFDLIVGTSTGGILALSLARPGIGRPAQFSARRVVRLYEEHGEKIFTNSFWRKLRTFGGVLDEAYSHQNLEAVLLRYFDNSRLGQCRVPTMVTTYDIHNRKSIFLKSWQSSYLEVFCRDAARATSAAPTYFEPKILDTGKTQHTLIDGGIFINSPAVSAYAEALKLFPGDEIKVMSLGTGELTRAIPYHNAKTWGSALWVISLLDCMFDGASKAADYQMRVFLGEHYQRIQMPLTYASDDMDDASKGNIRNLKHTAKELIESADPQIVRFFD
jgi:patatin-like phospholipase/acyl hydrolase